MRSNTKDGLFMTFNKTQFEKGIMKKSRTSFIPKKIIKDNWLYD